MPLCLILAIVVSATPTPEPTAHALGLGGVALGTSIVDEFKAFGMPDVVQTRDDGQLFQWSDKGGIDREVVTDDALVVRSVLVARPDAASTAQPPEAPVLGMDSAKAAVAITALGGVRAAYDNVWRLGDGYVVLESERSTVVRVRAVDIATARRQGYAGDPPVSPDHKAPVLVKAFIPYFWPNGTGTVIVVVDVDAHGGVADTRVLLSSGNGSVDEFEVQSMRRSTFSPASCSGTPCAGVYLDIGGMSR